MYSPPLTHSISVKPKKGTLVPFPFCFGGADQARTDDPLLAKQVLYQLSYNPKTLHFHHESERILYIISINVNKKLKGRKNIDKLYLSSTIN